MNPTVERNKVSDFAAFIVANNYYHTENKQKKSLELILKPIRKNKTQGRPIHFILFKNPLHIHMREREIT